MGFSQSPDDELAISTKVVIAGGFGVGKTTLVGAVSEVPPLTTEALMTEASVEVDDLGAVPNKSTTTVAMDFGRITIDPTLVLYLFGTPGQDRFWFIWDDLVRGALGAVILADTRRLDSCFPALNYFENSCQLPYIIAVNCFDGVLTHPLEEVRDALAVGADVPVVSCDVRNPASAREVLLRLLTWALENA